MPLANGSATHVTARAAAVAGGAGWKCCGKSFRYTGLKVDETMGDLGLVPTPLQKFCYALYRPCCMRPPLRLPQQCLTAQKGSREPQKGRIFFLIELESVIFTCLF